MPPSRRLLLMQLIEYKGLEGKIPVNSCGHYSALPSQIWFRAVQLQRNGQCGNASVPLMPTTYSRPPRRNRQTAVPGAEPICYLIWIQGPTASWRTLLCRFHLRQLRLRGQPYHASGDTRVGYLCEECNAKGGL
jgi:hypothetical protein